MSSWMPYKSLTVPSSTSGDGGMYLTEDLEFLAEQCANPRGSSHQGAALPSNMYNNGLSGSGATLTATSNGALIVDSYFVQPGDVVVVNNEGTQANNGIYVVTDAGNSVLHTY